MSKLICNVYKSKRKDETYLYVSIKDDLTKVPEALLDTFGAPELVTKLVLQEGRTLARADVDKVITDIENNGFYLQLPPPKEDYMLDLYEVRETNH